MLDLEFQNKMNRLKRTNNLSDDYFKKSLQFKNIIDDFNLIKKINDRFFIELYKKNFLLILDFETKNNFDYNDEEISHIETELQNIFIDKKYNQIFEYMILKSNDKDDFYGSKINFILFIFKEINHHVDILNQISKIWSNHYKHVYPKFSDFKNSKDFELVSLMLFTEKQKEDLQQVDDYYSITKNKLDFSNIYDISSFLIFTSINSDFYIEELIYENVNEKLFENKKEFYKKSGYKLLENLKNKIISYN